MSLSATSPPTPPPLANEDRGSFVTAIFWVETGIAILFVCGRFYARTLIGALGLDDWSMLLTVTLLIATSGVVTSTSNLGGFRHSAYVPPENATQVILNTYILQTLTTFAFGTSKFSIGYMILRLLSTGSVKRRRFIWGLIIFACIYNWGEALSIWFQCMPTRALWDFTIAGTCWSLEAKLINIYVGGTWNIVIDFILALFPATFIWKLKMALGQRVSLSVLLGLSLLAGMCGIAKLTYVHLLRDLSDVTWNNIPLELWTGSEVFVIIICGSVPPLKVIWDQLVKKIRQIRHVPMSPDTYTRAENGYIEMSGKHRNEASPLSSTTEDGGSRWMTATTEIQITNESG